MQSDQILNSNPDMGRVFQRVDCQTPELEFAQPSPKVCTLPGVLLAIDVQLISVSVKEMLFLSKYNWLISMPCCCDITSSHYAIRFLLCCAPAGYLFMLYDQSVNPLKYSPHIWITVQNLHTGRLL